MNPDENRLYENKSGNCTPLQGNRVKRKKSGFLFIVLLPSGWYLSSYNSLATETEQSEHKGFANLLKGFFGMFRNTTAHAPRIAWEITENDALDIMTLASLFHRRLDSSQKIRNV